MGYECKIIVGVYPIEFQYLMIFLNMILSVILHKIMAELQVLLLRKTDCDVHCLVVDLAVLV